jgi:hypothetical protein
LSTEKNADPIFFVAVRDVKTGELLNPEYLTFNRRQSAEDDLKTEVKIPYYKGEGQTIKVSVFANDDAEESEEPQLLEGNLMGSAVVIVDDLVKQQEKGETFALDGAKLPTESDKAPDVVLVCLVPDEAAQAKVLLVSLSVLAVRFFAFRSFDRIVVVVVLYILNASPSGYTRVLSTAQVPLKGQIVCSVEQMVLCCGAMVEWMYREPRLTNKCMHVAGTQTASNAPEGQRAKDGPTQGKQPRVGLLAFV